VLLTITTTAEPGTDASDLGYLLVKHPDRVHGFDVPSGTTYVFFPEVEPQRCTVALLLDVDPGRLSGGARQAGSPTFTLGRFVNDRSYAATSLLAAALNRAFRSAMRGECRNRPALALTPIPLQIRIPALRCRGGAELAGRLFGPLGWTVAAAAVPLDPTRPEWGDSRYVDLRLTGRTRLADALNQLYVLLPVLDDAKHYWVSPDEVDKLVRAGSGWLATHPDRALIAHRYLAHSRALAADANERLQALRSAEGIEDLDTVDTAATADGDEDAELPEAVRQVPLAQQRRQAVVAELIRSGATSVLDLGCGPGALLTDLARERRFTRLVGVDVSTTALRMAHRRLRLDRVPERQQDRVRLLQSALTYTDDRLVGFDAAVLMEVIEHVDPPRLPALAAAVFGHARPSTVVITTPNVEYNRNYVGLHGMRHHDHRFEWTRAEFEAWCHQTAATYGYTVTFTGVGESDPELGYPTQLATFERSAT
jgi:3' terminal RNA ribose 2'-O-methyltransferase Hen1